MFCTACGAQTAPGPRGQWGAPPPPPHPAHQQPPYQQPPPQRRDEGSTVVRVVVLVVIILVLLAAVAWAVLWTIIDDIPEDELHPGTILNLAAPLVVRRDAGNETVWDVSITINRVTSDLGALSWAFVRITLMESSGTVLVADGTPLPDDPGAYDNGSDGDVDVELWYVDAASDGLIEEADGIKITGMDRDYAGGRVVIGYTGDRIGMSVLPTLFP